MRMPATIAWFEGVSVAALVAATLNGLAATGPDGNNADAGAAVVLLPSLIVTVALIYRVSRWRSTAAKWTLIVFTFILLLGNGLFFLARTDWIASLVFLGVGAIQLGALALLFTPSARAWLTAPLARPSDEALSRTFE